jgi:hypothetical protein
MSGTFDMLNDALFAQLDKLQSIDPANKEQMQLAIEQTNAVCGLAKNINHNMANAVRVAGILDRNGGDVEGMRGSMPRMLTGDRE